MDTDELKAIAGKYGKISKKGFYAGMGPGRLTGGYIGLETGEAVFPSAEVMEIYPEIDPGQLGPEETAVYATVLGGYFLGGLGLAKGVTKYQELKEKDLEYTRPFLKPSETLEDLKNYLDGNEEEKKLDEAFSMVFDEEDDEK